MLPESLTPCAHRRRRIRQRDSAHEISIGCMLHAKSNDATHDSAESLADRALEASEFRHGV